MMDSFMSKPSVHEEFSMMLMDRIEKIERENENLKEQLTKFQSNFEHYQKFHTFKFTTGFKSNYCMNIIHKIKTLLNVIMNNRITFQPTFAFWEYTVIDTNIENNENTENNENRYYISFKMYIHTTISVSMVEFKNWLNNNDINVEPVYGNIYELKLILQYLMSWNNTLPYLSDDHKIEIWKRGGTLFEEELNPIMTTELFTSSSNYIANEDLQKEYFRLVQYNEWKELFYD